VVADLGAAGMPVAPTIDELLIDGDHGSWAELGFTIADGCCDLGGVRLRFLSGGTSSGQGLLGWTLRDLVSTELDGLPTTASEQLPRAPALAHPNGVIAIDHVVAFSPSLDRSVRALQDAGLDLRRIREQPTPAGSPRQAFFRLGAEILEVVQMSPEAMQGIDGQEEPARFWGLAVRVADLDRMAESLGAHVSPIRPAVQPGRRIATLRRSAVLTVPLALMSEPPYGSS
jgi:hypothetical protein